MWKNAVQSSVAGRTPRHHKVSCSAWLPDGNASMQSREGRRFGHSLLLVQPDCERERGVRAQNDDLPVGLAAPPLVEGLSDRRSIVVNHPRHSIALWRASFEDHYLGDLRRPFVKHPAEDLAVVGEFNVQVVDLIEALRDRFGFRLDGRGPAPETKGSDAILHFGVTTATIRVGFEQVKPSHSPKVVVSQRGGNRQQTETVEDTDLNTPFGAQDPSQRVEQVAITMIAIGKPQAPDLFLTAKNLAREIRWKIPRRLSERLRPFNASTKTFIDPKRSPDRKEMRTLPGFPECDIGSQGPVTSLCVRRISRPPWPALLKHAQQTRLSAIRWYLQSLAPSFLGTQNRGS